MKELSDWEVFAKIIDDRIYGPMLRQEPKPVKGVRINPQERDARNIQRIINMTRRELERLASYASTS